MKLEAYLQSSSNKVAENRVLKFFVVIIGGAVLLNTILLSRAMNTARTILIPPGLNTRLEITREHASEETLRAYTRYVLGLAASYTQATARGQFEELLGMYAPDSYPEAKKSFYELADRIETAHITSAFYIQQILISPSSIEARGVRKQFVEVTRVDESVKSYLLHYQIIDGRFTLLSISEKQE